MIEHSCVSFFLTPRKIINFCQYAPIDWFISPGSIIIILKQNLKPQDFTGRIIAPNLRQKLNKRFFKTWILQCLQPIARAFLFYPIFSVCHWALWSCSQSFIDGDTTYLWQNEFLDNHDSLDFSKDISNPTKLVREVNLQMHEKHCVDNCNIDWSRWCRFNFWLQMLHQCWFRRFKLSPINMTGWQWDWC